MGACPNCGFDAKARTITIGRLTSYPNLGVCCDGVRIKMQPRLHILLDALMASGKAVFTNAALLNRIEYDGDGDDLNYIKTQICFLRKALAPLGLGGSVKTVRQSGYYFEYEDQEI